MLPNTASALRESKRNTLKDFLSVAGPLGVSHFLILTATDKASYLRVAKTPRVGVQTHQTAHAAQVLPVRHAATVHMSLVAYHVTVNSVQQGRVL